MFIWTIRTILGFSIFLTLTCKFQSKPRLFEKSHFFKLSGKWIYFVEVSSEKLPCVWKLPAGAFFLWQIDISGFWRHARSSKSVIFVFFVVFGPWWGRRRDFPCRWRACHLQGTARHLQGEARHLAGSWLCKVGVEPRISQNTSLQYHTPVTPEGVGGFGVSASMRILKTNRKCVFLSTFL